MSNKIRIEIEDATKAGLDSIVTNVEQAKQKAEAAAGATYNIGSQANDTYELRRDTSAEDAAQRRMDNARRLDAMVANQNATSQEDSRAAKLASEAAATAKLTAEVNHFNETLRRGAEYADRLSEELEQVDFPEQEIDSVRQLWFEIDKTRNATELAAQTFEKLGQQEAAQRLRVGLLQTSDSANKLKTALDRLEVRKVASDMDAAGNSARTVAVDLGAAARETHLAASGFTKLQQAASASAGRRGASGQGVLQLAYAVDDAQYGLRGIVNNIPNLVQGLGASAAAAGKLAILAVVISQVAAHYEDLQKLLSNPRGWAIVKEHATKAMASVSDTINANLQAARKAVFDFADAWGLVPDAVMQFAESELEATGKSIVARERLAAEKARQTAADKAIAETNEAASKRRQQNELDELAASENATAALTARAKSLRDAITAPTGKGFIPKTAEEIEKLNKQLMDVEAALDRVKQAKTKSDKAQREGDIDAARKRELEYHQSQIRSLDQVRHRLEEIAVLKKGKSTGVAGAYDLDAKSAKRLHDEEQKLLDIEANLAKAMRDRQLENSRLYYEANEELSRQSDELSHQIALENTLHDIAKRREAVESGTDDKEAEAQRQKARAAQESHLEHVRATTERARQLADKADRDEALSDAQKKQRREAYDQAVMDQITAESNARRDAASEQEKRDRDKATKNAALDRESLELRKKLAAEADAEYQRAVAADAEADKDKSERGDGVRKRATADLQKATSERQKAYAELDRQVADNQRRQEDQADKDLKARTKQRIADEIAVGKAREKALADAAAREKELEDEKNARRQAAIQQEPRVQQVATQIAGRIKQKDVVREAMKRRQDEAAKKFIAERRQQGKKVKAADVKAVRNKAGAKFNKELKEGRADAELAGIANEMFDRMVDQTRGLAKPVADALKAIAAKAANDIREAAVARADIAAAENAKPGDKKAQKAAEDKEKADARKKEQEQRAENEPPKPVKAAPQKTAEQIREEIAAKREAKHKAEAEAVAKKEAAKEAKRKRDEEDVANNSREVAERFAMERESPEQRAAREKREDDEFRRQRAAEHDAMQQRAFEDSQRRGNQPALAPNQAANNQAVGAVDSGLKQLADNQSKADSAVIDALNSVAQMLTEQARRQVQLHDVVSQITNHVNQLQGQFLAADDALQVRAFRAGVA